MAQTQNPLNKIKDKIYEAEGLLELLHLRPEKLSDLGPMILERLADAQSDFKAYLADAPAPEDLEETEDLEQLEIPEYEEAPESDESDKSDESDESDQSDKSDESDQSASASRPRPAFCLNDRYRFRRAIFGGSDAEMNTTLDFVASMPSYKDAEEFFLTDMDLDKEDEDVADFLAIIRNYFGE